MKYLVLRCAAALLLLAWPLAAQMVPSLMNYQGHLVNAGGTNLADGNYNLAFRIYNTDLGGTLLWGPQTFSGVPLVSGRFNLFLGPVDATNGPLANAFLSEHAYLEIQVPPNSPITPRQRILTAPYAFKAGDSQKLAGTNWGAVFENGDPATGIISGSLLSRSWKLAGNTGTTADDFLGTLDTRPLLFKVNGQRALRLEATATGDPNVIGGALNNTVSAGISGATISGGFSSTISADAATISGGRENTIERDANWANIGGGRGNIIRANAPHSTIGGGGDNVIFTTATATIGGGGGNIIQSGASSATIAGGSENTIQTNSNFATISGGWRNTIEAIITATDSTTISGGRMNTIQSDADNGTIGGGTENRIGNAADSATVAGGRGNSIQNGASFATISGGRDNIINTNAFGAGISSGQENMIQTESYFANISGGSASTIGANSRYGHIAGGYINTIQPDSSVATIGGGAQNTIKTNSDYAIIAGGSGNTNGPSADYSVISGGSLNEIRGMSESTVVAGGRLNIVNTNSSYCVIAGGLENRVDSGASYATVGGGYSNRASGNFSFAAGRRAIARHDGSFVWADSRDADFSSTGPNQFFIRATGGVLILTGLPTIANPFGIGVSLNDGDSSWNSFSDRNVKKNFACVDVQTILEKLARVPVLRWNYKSEPDDAVPHIGPMAQDFKPAFYPGRDEKTISTMEFDGVALAAIQGLHQIVERQKASLAEREKEIHGLQQSVKTFQEQLVALERRQAELEARLSSRETAGVADGLGGSGTVSRVGAKGRQ